MSRTYFSAGPKRLNNGAKFARRPPTMLFNSFDYLLFLTLVFVGFWLLEPRTASWLWSRPLKPALVTGLQKLRMLLLLVASYLFYMSWSPAFLLLIVGSTFLDYGVGHGLGRTEGTIARRGWLALSLVANLGLLGLFKYADFGLSALADISKVIGHPWSPELLRLTLPVGISFYTFQTLSYTIDVYRKRIEPTKSLMKFATYVAFFPQLVAGPIVRAREFLPQLGERPRLSQAGAQSAIWLIARGLAKKILVADLLADRLCDRVFQTPTAFSGAEVWVAVFAYTWQLYGDFSGYTDIARGSARLFGLELPENFNRPFNSTGPIEFWKRWHITLSSWVQDYLYISLGGSQKGQVRAYLNLFVSFLVIGIWHGAGWTFVLFGLWHAVGVTANRLYRARSGAKGEPSRGPAKRWPWVLLNFSFFVIHWPIFRSPDVSTMWEVYGQMFGSDWESLRIGPWVWLVLVAMTFSHFCPHRWVDEAQTRLRALPWPLLGLILLILASLCMVVAAEQASPFIYFQF